VQVTLGNKQRKGQARGFIAGSIDAKHHQMIQDCQAARDMWNRLEIEYVVRGPISVDALLSEYYTYKMSRSKGVTEYVAHIDSLVSKLKQVKKNLTDEEVIAKIVSGLTPEYENFKRIWQLMSSAYKSKQLLIENLKKESRSLEENTGQEEAFVARQHNNKKKRARQVPEEKCNWCSKTGHFWRQCPTRPEDQRNGRKPNKQISLRTASRLVPLTRVNEHSLRMLVQEKIPTPGSSTSVPRHT